MLKAFAVVVVLAVTAANALPLTVSERSPLPSCYVSNGLIQIVDMPPSTKCLIRSDNVNQVSVATSVTNLTLSGLAANDPIIITLFTQPGCTGLLQSIVCTDLPDTYCWINYYSRVMTAIDLAPNVGCVKRNDLPKTINTPAADGILFFHTVAEKCVVEIELYSDAECTKQLASNHGLYCRCSNPSIAIY